MTGILHRSSLILACSALTLMLGACSSSQEPVVACRDVPDADSNCAPRGRWTEEWKEAGTTLPSMPAAEDLIPIAAPDGTASYEYLVDRQSVSRGKDDVMRYTVVVRSTTGTENVFFEGIRCDKNQVRTYAYASSEGAFRPVDGDWTPIAARGARGYQNYLLQHIMCDQYGYAWDPERVSEALGSQYTAGGVRVERFCGNLSDCNTTGRRF